jgi:hypothetical protein
MVETYIRKIVFLIHVSNKNNLIRNSNCVSNHFYLMALKSNLFRFNSIGLCDDDIDVVKRSIVTSIFSGIYASYIYIIRFPIGLSNLNEFFGIPCHTILWYSLYGYICPIFIPILIIIPKSIMGISIDVCYIIYLFFALIRAISETFKILSILRYTLTVSKLILLENI